MQNTTVFGAMVCLSKCGLQVSRKFSTETDVGEYGVYCVCGVLKNKAPKITLAQLNDFSKTLSALCLLSQLGILGSMNELQ